MSMLGQMGDMYKLQREAKKIKKELAKIHVSAESDGIKVVVSAEQEVLSVEVLDPEILQNQKKLEKAIVDATNRAMKKAQQVAADKMKGVMGGFPGMG